MYKVLGRCAGVLAIVAIAAFLACAAKASVTEPPKSPCAELPKSLQSQCTGKGVTCVARKDHHERWEAVFATEPRKTTATARMAAVKAKGFSKVHVEADVKCSNGAGVYEVAWSRFTTRAAAAALVAKAKAAGFTNARVEES
jgi:hypothetical protein